MDNPKTILKNIISHFQDHSTVAEDAVKRVMETVEAAKKAAEEERKKRIEEIAGGK